MNKYNPQEKNIIKIFGFPLVNSRDKVFILFIQMKGDPPTKILRADDKLDEILEESLDLLVVYTATLRDSFLEIILTEDLNLNQFDKIRKEYIRVDTEMRSLLGRLCTINRQKVPTANDMTNLFMHDLYVFYDFYIKPLRDYIFHLELY